VIRIPATPVFDPDLPTALLPDDRPGCGEARTAERALPLVAIDIDARLSGLTAWCRLRQRFTNPTEQPVEVTYIFPLPNRGAVTAMTATLGGRRVEGRLLERGGARQSYEEALAAGQRASLAEKDRPDVFTVTLGNLRPGEDAEVELDLVGPLSALRRGCGAHGPAACPRRPALDATGSRPGPGTGRRGWLRGAAPPAGACSAGLGPGSAPSPAPASGGRSAAAR